ncbi:cobalamin biosynthesis protein [Anabaena subtropica]|uniref:Cobalamin biosynthesis protein n=1 Tax=Anabaena subtropica FACHB-260 TaxID=2692884 RepID=A0ABR8CN30_9NOST|nr:cobalamin biosynthesis protein [Anabaena subtropica]MBD2343833.1 cobalamin biosynthesis protein [Anabaena subtropica FACHB-260]
MKLKIIEQRCFLDNLWLGFGCQSGISHHLIAAAIHQVFQENQLEQKEIVGIATIDTKASEPGLVEFCDLFNLPLKTFSIEMLANIAVPNPSRVIAEKVGIPSVAEAAAIIAVSANEKQQLGVKLLVPKRIFRLPGQPGVVTIAVAQASSNNFGF